MYRTDISNWDTGYDRSLTYRNFVHSFARTSMDLPIWWRTHHFRRHECPLLDRMSIQVVEVYRPPLRTSSLPYLESNAVRLIPFVFAETFVVYHYNDTFLIIPFVSKAASKYESRSWPSQY